MCYECGTHATIVALLHMQQIATTVLSVTIIMLLHMSHNYYTSALATINTLKDDMHVRLLLICAFLVP